MFENCAAPGNEATADDIVNAILREMHLLLEEHELILSSIREGSSDREEKLGK